MHENLGVLELELSDEQVERLSETSGFRVGFPREFLESDDVRGLIFGDTFELIDNHRSAAAPRRKAPVA
jgi:hypothetical protein